MRTVYTLCRRELAAYFDGPLAYFVVPVYTVLVGVFALWFDDLFAGGVASLRGMFFWSSIFLLLYAPAVTMRLFAEERRSGSLELLVTLPITEAELVLGKFAAALTLVAVAIATTLPYAAAVAWLGTPEVAANAAPRLLRALTESGLDLGPALGGYVAMLLLGAARAAIGTAPSAASTNQVVAFLLAVTVSFIPFSVGFFIDSVPAGWQSIVGSIGFQSHVDNLVRGVVDSRDLVYWATVCGLALHVALFSLERRRLA